jgi:hypothetical protein
VNKNFRRFLPVLCLLGVAAIGPPLTARQAAQPASSGSAAVSVSAQGSGRLHSIAYSADQVTEISQTLADGTKVTEKRLAKIYQDSQGRKRYENYRVGMESAGQDQSPDYILIQDPVDGVTYSLNPRDHTAQKTEIPRPTSPPVRPTAPNPAAAQPAMPKPTREELGTQVIEGLEAKGERITRTIPEGAEGNDRPIQITREIWYSVAMPSIVLMRTTNDPRRGETVTRLTDIVFEEPPAELFQVPADYTLKELQTVAKPEPPSD